jgi:probable F420-dependent oxidoreductase
MRELVQAVRAIWACWQERKPLDFRGRFYTHTLMTPFFDPGPNPHGLPPVYLAGVGPRMTEVAGEVADGLLVHPFNTPEFIAADTLPALAEGERRAGRAAGSVAVSCQVIVATGLDEEERARNHELARGQVAFYASTPAYRPVLERHGMGDLQPRLNALSKEGKWQEMARMLSDDLIARVVVSGDPEEAGARLRERCAGWCTRLSPVIYTAQPELHRRLLQGIRSS